MMYWLYDNYGGWGYNMMLGGGIMMLVFLVLFIALVAWFVREVSGRYDNNSSSRALDILKERYVKGEINKEEFESKKKDLA